MVAPPVISEAAKPAAATKPLIFDVAVIVRSPPVWYHFYSFRPLASGDHLPARSTEDVKLAWIENDGRLLAGLQTRRGGFRQHHAERLAAALHRHDRHVAQRLQHGDAGAEALLAFSCKADIARPDAK